VAVSVVVGACLLQAGPGGASDTGPSGCPQARLPAPRRAALAGALAAGRDILGARLLRSPTGPSYEAVRRLLPPLWYARGRSGTSLTRTGAYYLAFAYPLSLYGEKAFALHVADGSEIVTRRAGGPSLTLFVGDGRERFGSCLARLASVRLAHGYVPILRTAYTDARGVRYRQESFAGRAPGARSLVSFVRLAVDASRARGRTAIVRFVPAGARARLVAEGQGPVGRGGARYRVEGTGVMHVAWVHSPGRGKVVADGAAYEQARGATERFWQQELARGAVFRVPERRVLDAERNLLVQLRILTWRYSVGNPYEELSPVEALDAARVLAAYGHTDVSAAILRFSLRRLATRFTGWRAGALLVAAATHVRLAADTAFVNAQWPALAAVLGRLERRIERPGGTGLLDPQAFSSDVSRRVVALHGQAVVWNGLQSMSRVLARTGHPRAAAGARTAALRLGRALRTAIRRSERTTPDRSLFVPAALFERTAPFGRVTATREGSYWNLVMPYALASGLLPAEGRRARGIWRFMSTHGARLLGLVRADAARLYRAEPSPASGVDQVYGLDVARFLADADLPDQLVLSLYGTLAGAMTRDTFVSGEAATVVPLAGTSRGSMYLPPNGGTSSAFLETLRVALVHERRDGRGAPVGLDLAFATPRAWLGAGKTIGVERAPTSFGPVSYTVSRRGRSIHVTVDAPRTPPLRLRLRLPTGERVTHVAGVGFRARLDPASATIDLPSPRTRTIRLVARIGP